MAKLAPVQAIEILKAPLNKPRLNQAIKQERRLMFHCEPVQDLSDVSVAYGDFLAWAQKLITPDKLKRFIALLPAPIDTIASTKTIFNELSKVYETDDKYIKFEFVSDEIEADANEYAAKLKDADFWKTEGFTAMKTSICSLVVVDLPATQVSSRPEPYYYFVDVTKIIDVDFFKDGRVSYLAFKRGDGNVIYIDEQSYMVFIMNDKSEYQLLSSSVHSAYDENGQLIEGLGYAPAKSFYDQTIKNTNHINKKGPITDALSKLDWLLFWRTSKKYFDLYGAWPIMVQFKRSCEYRDEHGNECNEGFINYENESITDNGSVFIPMQKACPACTGKSILGPGSMYEVDPPRDGNDVNLMDGDPIKFIEVSTDKLEYVVTELERLENEVYLDCVGWDGDAMSKQAVNDDQVAANLVSKEAVLDTIKSEVEHTHKFAMDTVYRLRYDNYFLRSTVDYGTNYFLKTESELTKEYNDAKTAGLPAYMVADLRDKVNRTANKNNPDRLLRNQILEQLEPYTDYKVSELAGMQIPAIDPTGYVIKLNFNNFIQRFEREQMDIVQFGSLIDFKTKISTIQKTLESYAKEKNPIPQPNTPAA